MLLPSPSRVFHVVFSFPKEKHPSLSSPFRNADRCSMLLLLSDIFWSILSKPNSSGVFERHSQSLWMQSIRVDSPFSARSTVESDISAKSASCCCVHPRRRLSVRSKVLRMLSCLHALVSQFSFY